MLVYLNFGKFGVWLRLGRIEDCNRWREDKEFEY